MTVNTDAYAAERKKWREFPRVRPPDIVVPRDSCYVGDDRVTPQPGFYYGGWVTPDLVGPFKGVPGSESW